MKRSESTRGQRHIYITRNTEYHLRGDVCIAVRSRQTGEWLSNHEARGRRLRGCLRATAHGSFDVRFGMASPGDRLCFHPDVTTSPVRSVRIVRTGTEIQRPLVAATAV